MESLPGYDNWKTSPPDNDAYQVLSEWVDELDGAELLAQCRWHNIDTEGVPRGTLRDELTDRLAWDCEI